jgi:phenylalanyl-tRNA synthetase beta chain
MKIPLIWLKDYVETTKSAKDIAADFTQLGLMLDKPLDETNVLDLEQRLNRSDLLSVIGCARDLAAFEGLKLKLPKSHTKPGKPSTSSTKIDINVTSPTVRRFQTRVFTGIKVGPSPSWLTDRLKLYGMEPINNIVDITNFVMCEYAQPLHAQDLAKLKGRDITLRQAKPGEKVTTLLGTEVALDQDTFVLSSGGQVTVIGGIVGGKNTGVDTTTTDIVLDAGNYDSRVIRRTSRKLKIMNETVSRTDKFLDPRTIDKALDRATYLILELAGGTYYQNDDYYPKPVTPQTMTLRLSRLKLLSGMDISVPVVKKILKSLEYELVEEGEGTLTVEVPYFRTDVEVEDDLVSDILRINNYMNIPQTPLTTPVPQDLTPAIYRFEERLKDLLVAQGAHEHITNSLTSATGQDNQVILVNALTSDQNALRTELESGLKHVRSTYKKHKQAATPIFEIGKVFQVAGNKYLEGRLLTLTAPEPQSVADSLSTLMAALAVKDYHITSNHQIYVSNSLVGNLTALSYTLVTTALMPLVGNYSGIISEFSHSTSLDLSLLVPPGLVYADILTALASLKGEWTHVICKSVTKMAKSNNYLLSLTWPASSKHVQTDKERILITLHNKLKITSKS